MCVGLFAALRQLGSIRHLVSATVFQRLISFLLTYLSLPWSSVDSTMVMAHWSASRPTLIVYRIQSLQNAAAARLVFRLRRSDDDHVTDALVSLHWLRVPERIIFKVAVQTYRALHGDAPQYLRQFTPIADIPSRQRLRSSSSDDLLIPAVRLPTIGRRAFLVAGARRWNDVTSAPSLLAFRKRLHLFTIRYDTIVEFNVDSKAEYSALSSTRSQKKKLKQTTPVPL